MYHNMAYIRLPYIKQAFILASYAKTYIICATLYIYFMRGCEGLSRMSI